MSAVIRIKELRHRKQRREKLRKLRAKYAKATSEDQKSKILEHARKVALWLSEEEFLAPLNKETVAKN